MRKPIHSTIKEAVINSLVFRLLMLLMVLSWSAALMAQPTWQSEATRTGSGNSVSVGKPAGLAAGDLMVLGIAFDKGSIVSISATGWTLIQRTNQGNDHGFASYYKIATAADLPATDITFSVTANPTWAIGVSRITAFDAEDPINVSDGASSATLSTSVVAPSITTTEENTLVLAFYSNNVNATFTPAANTTERYDAPRTGGPSNMMASYVQVTAGATGSKTAESTISSSWVAQQLAINPLPFIFRSRQTGNWNDNNTWEQSDGAGGWVNTEASPQSDQQATIQTGHTVTVTANQGAGNTTVDAGGVLVVNTSISLSIPTTMALTVNGALRMPGTSVVAGAGSFSLNAGANIEIGSTAGITLSPDATGNIQVTGSRSFDIAANYTYNGTAAQLTGNGFPGTANDLTINNIHGLKAQADITVNGVLNLASANPNETDGTLDMVIDYGGYVTYTATAPEYLTTQRTQEGDILSSYILHMGPTATTIGQGDVTGRVKRNTIAANTAYTFGSQYTTITFSSAETLPTDMMFVITKGPERGIHPNKTTTVQRLYQVIRTGGATPNTFSVQFRYLESELNGNIASDLVLWDHHIPYNSTNTPHEHGKTTQSTSEHWVALSGHSITYIADKEEISETSFTKYWMFSNTLIDGNKWQGAAQGDNTSWNNLSNWTAGNVPTATDNVIIPGTGISYWPELPNDAVANSVTIESGGRLEGGSGTLTLKGGITDAGGVGSWNNSGTFNAGTSSVVFDFVGTLTETATATISGETVFYNVSVTSDTDLIMQSGSDIDIKGSLTNSGNIDATTFNNTIGYNGTDQAIIDPNGGSLGYHNLRLGENLSGTTTWPTSFSVSGNLINKRESLAITGTLTLSGSAQVQELGGTHPTSFQNLTVNNASGVSLGQSQSVTGTLDLTTGVVATGTNTLTVTGNISNASASSYVNGLLARNFTGIGSKDFPVGSATSYNPMSLNFTTFSCSESMVTAQYIEETLSGTLPPNLALYEDGFWRVTQSGCEDSFEYKITLVAAGFLPTQAQKAVILKKDNGTVTSYAATAPNFTNFSGFNSFSEFGLGELTLLTWTGGTSADWSIGGNWDLGVVPLATDDALIPGVLEAEAVYPLVTALIDSPSEVNNLTIASGAEVTIGPGKALTVHGELLNEAGVGGLIIESTAGGTGSLLHNTFNVDATLQRYISGATIPEDPSATPATLYHTVSVPLAQASEPRSDLFLNSYLYRYDAFSQIWYAMGSSTTNELESAMGYLIYFPEASKTYSFSGPMNSGEFEKAVVYGVHVSEENYKGFNLVPNPYPSAIDWDAESGWTKTSIDNAIWIWNPVTGNYAAYGSAAGTNGATQYIPVGQAYFVRASSDSPEPALISSNDVRVHNSQAFFKSQEQPQSELLRIRAAGNGSYDEVVVRFREGATTGHDSRHDAMKMYGNATSPQLYAVADDQQKLSIYSLPHPTGSISIPVGFEIAANGPASLAFEGVGSFDANMTVWLEDRHTGSVTDLRQTPSYSFGHEEESDPMRFVLHFGTEVPTRVTTLPEGIAYQIFSVNKQIHVRVPALVGNEATVEVFDLLGRRQLFERVALGSDAAIDASSLQGIAIVRVVTNGQVFTQRLMIK